MAVLRARPVRLLVLAIAALLVAACDPVPHTVSDVRVAVASPVGFRLLSGDGRYVVLEATGASGSVPGAGWWRVERATGSTVQLPGPATGISRDGTRVLLADGTLWRNGTVLTPPAGSVFSEDLTYAAFLAADSRIHTWDAATGTVRAVETGFPRANLTPPARPQGVSDDGTVVHFSFQSSVDAVERFIDLEAGAVLDIPRERAPDPTPEYEVDITERLRLSADGSAVLHTYESWVSAGPCECPPERLASWAELIAVPSGARGARSHNPAGESVRAVAISANGDTGWVYTLREETEHSDCSGGASPIPMSCAVSASVVAVGRNTSVAFGSVGLRLGSLDATPDGRFLVIDTYRAPLGLVANRGPVQVLDRYSQQRREVLSTPETYAEQDPFDCYAQYGSHTTPCTLPAWPARAQISDSGRLVATATTAGTGWYEFTPPAG